MKTFGSFYHKDIRISAHAQDRAAERTSIKDIYQLSHYAEMALNEGLDVLSDPTLRELCLKEALRHNASGLYSYMGIVFVFKDATLVTVFPIGYLAGPNQHGYAIA